MKSKKKSVFFLIAAAVLSIVLLIVLFASKQDGLSESAPETEKQTEKETELPEASSDAATQQDPDPYEITGTAETETEKTPETSFETEAETYVPEQTQTQPPETEGGQSAGADVRDDPDGELDFKPGEIMVALSKEYSNNPTGLSKEDFPELSIEEIYDVFKVEDLDNAPVDREKYRQIVCIVLTEKTKEAVIDGIEKLKTNGLVDRASPNHIMRIEEG